MAVTETVTRTAVVIKLDSGQTTSTGQTKTVNVNLGSLSPARYDADKVMSIVNLLIPCFEYSYVGAIKTTTASLEAA